MCPPGPDGAVATKKTCWDSMNRRIVSFILFDLSLIFCLFTWQSRIMLSPDDRGIPSNQAKGSQQSNGSISLDGFRRLVFSANRSSPIGDFGLFGNSMDDNSRFG